MIRRPNSELVVCEWLNTIAELTRTPNFAATELPRDNSTWGVSGFTVVSVVGGYRDMDINAGRPVAQLDVYTVQPNGSKPPWGAAFNMTEAIIRATQDEANLRRLLTLKARNASYGTARMLECYPIGEPARIYEDESSYARVTIPVQFHWVEVSHG